MTSPNPYAPGGWMTPTGATSSDPRGILPGDAATSASGGSVTGFPVGSPEDLRARELYYLSIQAAAIDANNKELSTWRKLQLQAQRDDAEKALQNARTIAQLTNETSRYGTDVQRRTQLDQLQQNQRQFDATHGLEMQKFGLDQNRFGLDVAKAYTDYASGPDTLFMLNDFQQGLASAGVGEGPQPYGAGAAPQARGWEDFAALAGFGNLPAVQARQSNGGPVMASAAAQSGGGSDPRIKAARSIIDAMPPSNGQGHDDNNFAALDAIEAVFRAARPGTYERLRPGQKKAFAAGLSRRGYYAPDAIEDMQRAGIGQGSVRAA